MLVKCLHAGDDRAFETIFKRHYAPLLSYCRHMLGDQDAAEDALQQALIKAHRALLGGTSPRELRPWLYAIARNCCLSAIAARKPTALLTDHTPSLAGLSERVHEREDLRELVADVARLPEDQRSALLLAELDDLSHQAIAAIVGCPVSRVKALIYQARSALIADRDARNASCQDIREQLSVAHGGELRRGPLRRHLKLCVGCRDFQLAVNTQRQSLAIVLPALPSVSLAAAIVGHGAVHAATVTASAGMGAGLPPAGGASVGVTATGATTTGGTGIATSTTAASTTISAGAVAGAGAGSSTSIGVLAGGGLLTKLAIGGAVVALATAGAVTAHSRAEHAIPHQVTRSQLSSFHATAQTGVITDIADSSSDGHTSSALAPGASTGLALVSGTWPADSLGSDSRPPSTELSSLGGVEPPAALTGTYSPSLVPSGIPDQPAGKAGPSVGNQKRHANARAKTRRAARHRRQLRRATVHRHRVAARRRARLHKTLRHHRPLAAPKPPKPLTPPKPPVTPTPVRAPHRKARTTTPPGTSGPPAETETTTTGSPLPEANKPRHRPAATTGATSTGTKTETGAAGTETGKTGSRSGTDPSETSSGSTTSPPSTKAHPKKHLIEEEQLPNL